MEDINTSFYDGALSKNLLEMMNESESDTDDEFGKKMEYFMSMPITYWIVISKDNRLYRFTCGFELMLCIISSYYYGFMATFHEPEGE